MEFKITNFISNKSYFVDGNSENVIESKIRELFPIHSMIVPQGDLNQLLWVIDRIPGMIIEGPISFPQTKGIIPNNEDPEHEDPWRREGDNVDLMNDFHLD